MTFHKKKVIRLICELRSGLADDKRQLEIVAELDIIFPDPNYWDYMVDYTLQLTADEVVERAFNYKPIQL